MTDWENMPSDEEIQQNTGFIYIIAHKFSGKYYIGQKKFWFKRSLKPLKGRKNKRHLVPSDWKTYWGSNKELLEDIKKEGVENFYKSIIELCASKALMNYYETKTQFKYDVLFDKNSYNSMVNCRISRNQVLKPHNSKK